MNNIVKNLLDSALDLAKILDWPTDEHGMIKMQYQFVAKIINAAQLAAKSAAEELTID